MAPMSAWRRRFGPGAEKVRKEIAKSGGRKQAELRERVFKLHIMREDLVDGHVLLEHMKDIEERMEEIELEAAVLYHEMQELVQEKAAVEEENAALRQAVEKFLYGVEEEGTKPLSEYGQRRARYKIKTLKTRAELALGFARRMGIDVEALLLKDAESGKVSQVLLGNTQIDGVKTATQVYVTKKSTADPVPVAAPRLAYAQAHATEAEEDCATAFEHLSQDKKDGIYRILHVLDRFWISDEAYHEVTMLPSGSGLPRSYLVKQARHCLNDLCEVHVVAENGVVGAKMSFKEMLRGEIAHYMTDQKIALPEKIKVKIGGDGAEMTRNSSFQMFGFSLLNWNRRVLQPSAVRNVACMAGPETYSTLRDGMGSVLAEVQDLIQRKEVEVDGKIIPLEFFLCGDTKYKQRLLGLMGSTSTYACPHCHVHMHQRHDVSVDDDYYESDSMKRKLDSDWHDGSFSHTKAPLLNIDVENVVLDELHLMLRVTDVLLDNLLAEAHELDCSNGGAGGPNGPAMRGLVEAVRSCGVSFDVWASKEKGKVLSCTSLMGSDKLKLLRLLPDKLHDVLHADTWRIMWRLNYVDSGP